MAEEIKKVSDIEFDKAYDEMCETLEAQTGFDGRWGGIEFHFTYDPNAEGYDKPWNRPKIMQVNWAAIGTVPPSQAAKFGKALMVAAKLAEDFIYNGYKVYYEE